MNLFEDANYLYDAGTKAMNGSKWKYSTQLFEINHLLETAVLQKKLTEKDYHPGRGQKFKICGSYAAGMQKQQYRILPGAQKQCNRTAEKSRKARKDFCKNRGRLQFTRESVLHPGWL